MTKNKNFFEFNFYKIKENRYQIMIAICIYILLIIGSVAFGLYIYGFDKHIVWGVNKQTLDNLTVFALSIFFILISPMTGIFKIYMYSRLVYKSEDLGLKTAIINPFGKKTLLENYEIYEGYSDYVQSFRFLWLKGKNYINDELIENEGCHFTLKDMNTGIFYLLTIDPDKVEFITEQDLKNE
ncbi:hypothetical protein [Acinetobacter sp.]|uniref:hypothetical protein n=1 Tax=Acinetobacter sp. TaxID=472 RepID=UPI0028A9C9C0|nr:hypothetical protein [Acinetobacter sp.]